MDAINDIRSAREGGKIQRVSPRSRASSLQLKAKSHGEMASLPADAEQPAEQPGRHRRWPAEAAPTESMREAFAFLSERADKLVAEVRTLLPRRSPGATRRARAETGGQHRDTPRGRSDVVSEVKRAAAIRPSVATPVVFFRTP
jgi:hypothetical protein